MLSSGFQVTGLGNGKICQNCLCTRVFQGFTCLWRFCIERIMNVLNRIYPVVRLLYAIFLLHGIEV